MVLFNDVVEVLAAAHLHVLPLRILASQEPQCAMTRHMAVQGHFPRPPSRIGRQRLFKEGLRGGDSSIRPEQEVHSHSLLIHGATEIVPLATNTDVSLVNPPGRTDTAREAMPPFLELGYVPNHPAQYRRVGYFHAPLGHHGYRVPITQPVGDVPAHAQLDDLGVENTTTVNGITSGGAGHFLVPKGGRIVGAFPQKHPKPPPMAVPKLSPLTTNHHSISPHS